MSWSNPLRILIVSRKYPGHVRENILDVSKKYPGHYPCQEPTCLDLKLRHYKGDENFLISTFGNFSWFTKHFNTENLLFFPKYRHQIVPNLRSWLDLVVLKFSQDLMRIPKTLYLGPYWKFSEPFFLYVSIISKFQLTLFFSKPLCTREMFLSKQIRAFPIFIQRGYFSINTFSILNSAKSSNGMFFENAVQEDIISWRHNFLNQKR